MKNIINEIHIIGPPRIMANIISFLGLLYPVLASYHAQEKTHKKGINIPAAVIIQIIFLQT